MNYSYRTSGVCSSQIEFTIEEGILKNIHFTGGCNGNLSGIAKLCEGQPAEEVLQKLEGVKCNTKSTSCPDQLSKALKEALSA